MATIRDPICATESESQREPFASTNEPADFGSFGSTNRGTLVQPDRSSDFGSYGSTNAVTKRDAFVSSYSAPVSLAVHRTDLRAYGDAFVAAQSFAHVHPDNSNDESHRSRK